MTALLLVVKGTLLLVVAAACVLVLPKRAYALRHLVWATSLGALLVLPLFVVLPGIRVAVPVAVTPLLVPATQQSAPALPAFPEDAAASVRVHERDRAVSSGVAVVRAALPLVTAWAAVAAAILLWLLIGHLALWRLLRRAERLADGTGLEPLPDAAWLHEVTRAVALYRSDAVSMPMTWGMLRSVIVLPAEAVSWSEERRCVVLLHELAHVRRRDGATQFMASVACALWWFHPLAWYAARRMRVEREHACDDMVLAAGTVPADYAAHLLELARQYRASFTAPVLTLAMARPGHLEGRLLTVLAGPSGRAAPGRFAVGASAVCTLVLVAGVGAVQPTAAVPELSAGAPVAPGDDVAATTPVEPAFIAAAGDDAIVPGVPLRSASFADSLPARPPLPRDRAQAPGIAVSAAILDRYVGEYRSSPSAPIATFRRDGTTLFVKPGTNPAASLNAGEVPLTALSETRFRDPRGQIYEFQLDAQGRVTGAIREHRGPQSSPSVRVVRLRKVE